MNPLHILLLVKFVYKLFLRDLVKATIDDPDTEWDDAVLDLLDTALGFDNGEKKADASPDYYRNNS